MYTLDLVNNLCQAPPEDIEPDSNDDFVSSFDADGDINTIYEYNYQGQKFINFYLLYKLFFLNKSEINFFFLKKDFYVLYIYINLHF